MSFTLFHGLRPDHRTDAARLYWAVFGSKLGRVLGPEADALRFIRRVMDETHVISALDQHGDQPHEQGGEHEGQQVGQHGRGAAQPGVDPARQAGHGQRRDQHQGALGEIEHPGRLEDQHEAQGHQGVEHAAHQPADHRFQKESHCGSSSSVNGPSGWRPDRHG